MHPLLRLVYGAAGAVARAATVAGLPGNSKLARTIRARRGARARFAEWAATSRDPARPLLWIHAPSVGEGLQARPILDLARAHRGDVQLAYTWFSPSAETFARALPVDLADVLPFDTTIDARVLLDALRPTALVFSKLDVWPILAAEAHARGVPLGLISATLAEGSSRRGLAGAFLRDAYASLDAVGAIDERDAARLVALGVRADRITVTGDARYDQVWARAGSVDRAGPLLGPLVADRPTLVAGSTWPADEAPLLAAWKDVVDGAPTGARPRLIIAPHEPTPAHLVPIERWATAATLTVSRLGMPGARDADVVLVDRVGVLGELYALADAAFVGGGFHAAGLHSVLEPAAFGAPVCFGPRYKTSRDAGLLLDDGGGATAATAAELARTLRKWFHGGRGDATARAEAGRRARALVLGGLGAAARSWALVERLLGPVARPA